MKNLIFCLLPLYLLTACGTATKVYDQGPIELNRMDGKTPMAPVVLIYQFKIPNQQHEIFFWDEDKNRFNLKVSGTQDTTKGILFYLPAGRSYALSGFLHVTPSFPTEYSFGTELPMFPVQQGRVNQIAYFEVSGNRDKFFIKRTKSAEENSPYRAAMAKRFGFAGKTVTIPAIE